MNMCVFNPICVKRLYPKRKEKILKANIFGAERVRENKKSTLTSLRPVLLASWLTTNFFGPVFHNISVRAHYLKPEADTIQ